MPNTMDEICADCGHRLWQHSDFAQMCPELVGGVLTEWKMNKKFTPIPQPVDQSRSVNTTAPTAEKADMVNSPSHYADNYPIEAIEIIKASLQAMFGDDWEIAFKGHCVATELKYRLRAGFKDADKVKQDIEKAMWYNQARREI